MRSNLNHNYVKNLYMINSIEKANINKEREKKINNMLYQLLYWGDYASNYIQTLIECKDPPHEPNTKVIKVLYFTLCDGESMWKTIDTDL